MGSYQYRVYGLNVDSEIEIPELVPGFVGNPDVRIRLGEVPITLPKCKVKGVFYQAIKDDFIFRMEKVGAFRVCNGEDVTIEPFSEGDRELIRVFLLGSVFGALLHQKGILAIHGSAVATEDGALVITGRSSSGKSTLAASLNTRGYPFIADDIAALHQSENGFLIHHGIPQMKLWKDVITKLEMVEGLNQVRPSIEKYKKMVVNGFQNQAKIVSRIIVLGSKNTHGIEIRALSGMDKFEPLKENTYRYEFVNGLQISGQHFQSITKLANSVKMFYVLRPSSPLMIEELADVVIDKILSNQK